MISLKWNKDVPKICFREIFVSSVRLSGCLLTIGLLPGYQIIDDKYVLLCEQIGQVP